MELVVVVPLLDGFDDSASKKYAALACEIELGSNDLPFPVPIMPVECRSIYGVLHAQCI
jgi:hypothetical protein